MDKELLLVKLPSIDNVKEEFFGIGYYSDSGFVFCLLTPDTINKFPLRMLPFPIDTGYVSSNQIEIIGSINSLPNPIRSDYNHLCKGTLL